MLPFPRRISLLRRIQASLVVFQPLPCFCMLQNRSLSIPPARRHHGAYNSRTDNASSALHSDAISWKVFRRCLLTPSTIRTDGVNPFVRFMSTHQTNTSRQKSANRNTVMYAIAIAITVTGLAYAAVPLYRIFCQASGYGGTVVKVDAGEKVEKMEPIREREITIQFNADTSSAMLWKFKPHQREIKLVPGETALAFYTAQNPTDRPVTGIATYNVIPFDAGVYFNKIQCFCFEEQRLNPHEQVDMPVFFYIDPEFDDDPLMAKVDTIILSYTFFESKEGEELPHPFNAPAH